MQIKADEHVIKDRIRNRIIKMVYDHGGLAECFKVFDTLGQKDDLDFEKGILQAIGYKEFFKLYQKCGSGFEIDPNVLDDEKAGILKECIEGLNVATVRYAKTQVKWLRKRISSIFKDNTQ